MQGKKKKRNGKQVNWLGELSSMWSKRNEMREKEKSGRERIDRQSDREERP